MLDPAALPPPSMSGGGAGDGRARTAEGLAFDPSDEYRKILDTASPPRRNASAVGLEGSGGKKPDAYQYLMGKERRVLDTVDRVVNDAIVKERTEATLFGMPMHELAMRAVGAVRSLMDDLVAARSIDDVMAALSDAPRRPYLGVAMVAVALLLAALQAF